MKKLQAAAIFMVIAAAAFADRVVSPEKLPKSAKALIAQHFPGKMATYVETGFNEYEVSLSDGTEINFSGAGNWNEIKSYTGVPAAVLPPQAAAFINQNHAGMAIVKAEKEWNGYEVELSNYMKLYFDKKGNILGQKFDD